MGKYTHMTPRETDLAKMWFKEGKNPNQIATLLKRDPKTVREKLKVKKDKKDKKCMKVGRPAMPEHDYEKRLRALDTPQLSKPGKEITAAMVRKKAKVTYCEEVIRNAFRAHGKPWRKLREKPLLTEEDMKKRLALAKDYDSKSAASWVESPHAAIDNKKFTAFLSLLNAIKRYSAPLQNVAPLPSICSDCSDRCSDRCSDYCVCCSDCSD